MRTMPLRRTGVCALPHIRGPRVIAIARATRFRLPKHTAVDRGARAEGNARERRDAVSYASPAVVARARRRGDAVIAP